MRKPHPALKKIFKAVENGAELEAAWTAAKKPVTLGQARRAHTAHLADLEAAEALRTLAVSPKRLSRVPAAGSSSNKRVAPPTAKKTYKTSKQKATEKSNEQEWHAAWKAAHKAATTEIDSLRKSKEIGKVGSTYADVATRFDATLARDAPDKYRITEGALRSWVKKKKKAGSSPQVSGPKPRRSKLILVKLVKAYARVMQLEGKVQLPKELLVKMKASVKGTMMEDLLDTKAKETNLLEDLRSGEDALNSSSAESVSSRRIDSLTKENATMWFDDWEELLKDRGFGTYKVYKGKKTMYIPKQMRYRIINPDEFNQVMSTELEKGGTRAKAYMDPKLGAACRASVTNQRHTTGMYSTNAAKEVLPGYWEFDSGAAAGNDSETLKVNAKWLNKLPKVRGMFGHGKMVTLKPGFEVSAKGGTGKGSFMNWIYKVIDPAYPPDRVTPDWVFDESGEKDADGLRPIISGPIIIKTDLGPDRVEKDEEGLEERRKRHRDGYIAYPNLVNGTAVFQEMDQLYRELKAAQQAVANEIVTEREIKAGEARAAKRQKIPSINLTNDDIPRIVNGKPGAPLAQRPFEYSLGPEKVGEAWDAVGAVSTEGWVTRAAMNHPKVRGGGEDESGETKGKSPEEWRAALDGAAEEAAEQGFNVTIFKVYTKPKGGKGGRGQGKVRTPANVAPSTAEEDELQEDLDSGCYNGWAVYHKAAARGCWTDEVLMPMLTNIREDKEKKLTTKATKDEAFEKLQEEVVDIVESTISIEILTTPSLAKITRYIFQAIGQTGYSSVVKDRSLMLANLMEVLGMQGLAELLVDPPKLSDDTHAAARYPTLRTSSSAGASGSGTDSYVTFGEKFGEMAAIEEEGYAGFEPVAAPPWLSDAIIFKSDTAERLVGYAVAISDEDGWSVGSISQVLTNNRSKAKVYDEQGKSIGTFPKNFEVSYNLSTKTVKLKHVLHMSAYATSVSDADLESKGSWVLLGEKPKRGKAKPRQGKAKVVHENLVPGGDRPAHLPPPDQAEVSEVVRSWSKAERAAMRAALAEHPD